MAEISASMVMDLRQRTGLGMMECKKALTEAAGDLAKGRRTAAHQERRQGVEGRGPHRRRRRHRPRTSRPMRRSAAMVEVNCETDFVAKNDDFRAFAAELAQLVARDDPADLAALGARTLASGETVEARRVGARAEDRREHVAAPLRAALDARAGSRRTSTARRSACSSMSPAVHDTLGKDLAMHVAASKPMAVSQRRRACRRHRAGAQDRGGPGGRIRQACEHRREDGRRRASPNSSPRSRCSASRSSRATASRRSAARQGARRTVHGFVLYVVGEGIEKKKEDFAAEVAAMAKA